MPKSDFFARLGLFIIKDFLDAESCQRLCLEARSATHTRALTRRYGGTDVTIVDESFRRAKSVKVSKQTRRLIKEHLLGVKPVLERHFNVELVDCQNPDFLVYKEGDFFRHHQDANYNHPGCPEEFKERQVSVVIFLNSQAEALKAGTYVGGSLTFYGLIDDPAWKEYGFPLVGEAGLLIAFRPDLYHQVSTITRGERYTIVTWFV